TAVVRPAVSGEFRERTKDEIQRCLDLYKISQPYLLNTARWDPKKNLRILLQTFLGMKRAGLLPRHSLVLVGGPIGNFKSNEDLRLLIKNSEQFGTVWIGHVAQEHLPALYSGADVFVFPSTHEGFGIPVLEARACRARVVASDISALHEAGEEDVTYVAPTEDGLRAGILSVLGSPTRPAVRHLWNWRDSGQVLAAALVGQPDR